MLSPILAQTIDQELRWREAEMALAKIHLHRALGDPIGFRFAYRCFAAMTCAHFEGFVKKVLAQALADIVRSGITQSSCNGIIRLTLLAPLARKLIEGLSNEELLEVVFLNPKALDRVPFPSPQEIFDVANMNFINFSRAISCVGLSASSFDTYKTVVNHLTSVRHECAHGEVLSFDGTKTDRELASTMFALQSTIITLIHQLSVELIDHFQERRFGLP